MGKSKIEWTDNVWNPNHGCTPVSAGCVNCYARRMHERFSKEPFSKVHGVVKHLHDPEHWRQPRKVFVCSMSDLFHEDIHPMWIRMAWEVMEKCPQHTFMVLTKRVERMHEILTNNSMWEFGKLVLPNVWLGASVENQPAAYSRIPWLRHTPAAKRFLSIEPMLGPVVVEKDLGRVNTNWSGRADDDPSRDGIDWVICGGESGPGARPMHPEWAESLRDQCQSAGVPYFFKQWGEWLPITCDNRHGVLRVDRQYPHCWVGHDGKVLSADGDIPDDFHWGMARVGKKAAGCLLDGREWKEFPCQ